MYSISIIIATYNADKFLKNCLDSICPQINGKTELIIIDGASLDHTIEIIKAYQSFINFWISEPDQGIYDAWNKGIKVANGEWIMFMGADDILLPNALKSYIDLLENKDISNYDYISGINEYVNKNGILLKLLGKGAEWKLMKKGMSAAHVGSLHNKINLFNTVGNYDLQFRICADYELLLRKRDNLKSFFINAMIAKMKVGGMSFSAKAIIETFKIRSKHNSVNLYLNILLFMRDYLAFNFFRLRKFV